MVKLTSVLRDAKYRNYLCRKQQSYAEKW